MNSNDGGPAFPIPEATNGVAPGFGGMSLRDYFAAKALNGLIATFSEQDRDQWRNVLKMTNARIAQHFAHDAYEVADAMLVERERRNK